MNNARGPSEWEEIYGRGFGVPAGPQLLQVPLERLDPWQDADGKAQPFRSYSDAELQELSDNIRQNGVITPIRIRPKGSRYEILAGHNRCTAAKMAGLTVVPAIMEQLDDEAAAIVLVDSNLQQRQNILPSEKAFAYKMKLDAMKRQGKRTDLTSRQNVGKLGGADVVPQQTPSDITSRQIVGKLEAADILGQSGGESGRQIQRYIRLTYLAPRLLELVDAGRLKLVAAGDISFLPQNIQERLADLMIDEGMKVSVTQAAEMKKVQPKTELDLRAILEEKPKPPAVKITLELPELDTLTVEKLNKDQEFQEEARRVLAELAKHYCKAQA